MSKLFSVLKACIPFAAGVLASIALRGDLGDATTVAAQEKRPASAEEQVKKLKLELPAVTKPTNTYVPAVRVGNLLFISGTVPPPVAGKPVVGRLGQNVDVAQGKELARQVGLQVLGIVKAELGSLDNVKRLVKTVGMVNATADFTQHPQVINGFSDLMVDVFGEEAGKGTRSAVGMSSLPFGSPVEIEAIFELKPGNPGKTVPLTP